MIEKKINRKWEIVSYLLLITLSVTIPFLFNGTRIFSSFSNFIKNFSFGFVLGFLFWKGNLVIGNISGRLRWKENAIWSNYLGQILTISYGVAVSFIVPFIYYKYVFHIGNDLTGHILGTAFLSLTLDFAISFSVYTSILTGKWKESIENEEKLKRENLIANYEALKSQINPHYLFNTFNTLTGIVEKDSRLATVYIKKLSDTFRYVLDQKDKETVKIADELAFIEDYIFLQKIRYGEGLGFTVKEIDGNGHIVPLALQILVENAIKHNVVNDETPLHMELKEENEFYILSNNLQMKKSIQNRTGMGLDNLCKRYDYLSDRKVEITEKKGEFIVKIPKLKLRS